MRDRLAKALEGASSSAAATRTIAAAFAIGTAAQTLNVLRTLPAVSSFLTLTGVFALSRVFGEQPTPAEEPALPPGVRVGARRRRTAGLLLSLAGAVAGAACSYALFLDFQEHLLTVLIAGPLGLTALGIGLDLFHGFELRPHNLASAGRRHRRVLLLILAAGLLFRFGSTGYFPPPDGFSSIEEMQRATGGAWILRGQRPWEFPLAQYIAAASFALFGPSMYALRLPVTLLAWLTLPLFYLLARRVAGKNAALFATALLAVSRWHCQIGWYAEDVYVPLFPFVLLLYLLVRTRTEARPSFYVAAGALCGYMLYDYAAYRSAPLIAALFFAADALWQRRLPRDWRSIALLFAVVLFFVPPLWAVLDRGRGTDFYLEALDRSLVDDRYYVADPVLFLEKRVQRINQAADVFTSTDHREFFATLNADDAPLLDPVTSLFFALGLGSTALLWRRRYHSFTAVAFIGLAVGAMIVPWNLDFRRLAILIPFVFLFPAFLVRQVEERAEAAGWAVFWRRLLVGAIVIAALFNADFLFLVLARDREVRAAHHTPYTIAADYLRHHLEPGQFVLILSPDLHNFFEPNDYDWIKPQRLFGRIAVSVDDLLSPEPRVPPRRDLLILITRPYDIRIVMSQVLDVYPGSTCEFRKDREQWRHDLGVCHVPKAQADAPAVPSRSRG